MKQLPLFHRAASHWKHHAVAYERDAALCALGAIAIAQPILDVMAVNGYRRCVCREVNEPSDRAPRVDMNGILEP